MARRKPRLNRLTTQLVRLALTVLTVGALFNQAHPVQAGVGVSAANGALGGTVTITFGGSGNPDADCEFIVSITRPNNSHFGTAWFGGCNATRTWTITPDAVGTWSVSVTMQKPCCDDPQWYGASSTTFSVTAAPDQTAPTTVHSLSGTVGAGGWYVTPVTITLSATDNGGPGAATGVSSTTLDGTPYSAPRVYDAQGLTTLSYFSQDVAGNVEPTKTATFRIDSVPPSTSVNLSGNAGNENWFRSPVTVSVSATDATSGVAELILNGSTYSAPLTFNGEGATSFTYQARDAAGNLESLRSGTVHIDSLPPVSTYALSGLAGNDGWYRSPITITLTSSDSTSGLSAITLNGAPYTGPSGYSTEGESTHIFFATDVAGNSEALQSFTSKIDSLPPQTTITSHPGGAPLRGIVTLSGAVSDATSGVAGVEVSIGGADWLPAGVAGDHWQFDLDTTRLADGPLTLHTRGHDVAGNVEAGADDGRHRLRVVVDNTAPDIRLVAPDRFCPLCGDRASLSFAARDAASGIGRWALSAGDIELASGLEPVETTWQWDGASLPPGPIALRLWAVDAAGNELVVDRPITVAAPAPPVASMTIDCPWPGDNGWCRAPVTITLGGTTSGAPISALSALFHDNLQTIQGHTFSFVEGRGGRHEISLTVADTTGQVSSKIVRAFKIDGGAPVLSFNGADATGLKLGMVDSQSGISEWTAQVFDAAGQSVFWHEGHGAFTGALKWSPLVGGSYTLDLFAKDAAGNESSLVRQAFQIEVPVPLVVARQIAAIVAPSLAVQTTAAESTSAPSATPRPEPTPTPNAPIVSVASPMEAPIVVHRQPGSVQVSGLVYRDRNGNGQHDDGEPGLAGVHIEVSLAGAVMVTVITDEHGRFQLELPNDQRYLLQVVPPRGLKVTANGTAVLFEGGNTFMAEVGVRPSATPGLLSLISMLALYMTWMLAALPDSRASAVDQLADDLSRALARRPEARELL